MTHGQTGLKDTGRPPPLMPSMHSPAHWPRHNSIQHVVTRIDRYRFASFHVSVDSRRHVAPVYSPNHIPDLSLIHAAPDGGHILTDVTTSSVTTRAACTDGWGLACYGSQLWCLGIWDGGTAVRPKLLLIYDHVSH